MFNRVLLSYTHPTFYQRMFNRKVYQHFREELCLRYARQFIADGEWDSPRADNLRTECQNVRGFETMMRDINN